MIINKSHKYSVYNILLKLIDNGSNSVKVPEGGLGLGAVLLAVSLDNLNQLLV